MKLRLLTSAATGITLKKRTSVSPVGDSHHDLPGSVWLNLRDPVAGQFLSLDAELEMANVRVPAEFDIESGSAKLARDSRTLPMARELWLNHQSTPIPPNAKQTFQQRAIHP